MGESVRVAEKKPVAKNQKSVYIVRKASTSQSRSHAVERILFLQRTVGNQAVQRLISSGTLQTKLRIRHPRNEHGQKADRVAEKVMRMSEPCVSGKMDRALESTNIQRKCPKLEENELQKLPMEEELSHGEVSPEVEQSIERSRGGGQAIDSKVRLQMESVFNADFSGVRIHTNSEADALNRSLDARAFTTGRDIFFRRSEYQPDNSQGRELLAHELTHVVQQNNSTVRGKLRVSKPQDSDELEADRMAKGVAKMLESGLSEITNPAPSGDTQASPQFAMLSRGLQLAHKEHNIAAIELLQQGVDLVAKQPDHPLVTSSSPLARTFGGSSHSCGGPALSSDECPMLMASRLKRQGMPQGEIQRMVIARATLARDGGGGRTTLQCINHNLSNAGIPWAVITIAGGVCGILGGIAGLAGGPAAPATAPSGAAVAAALCIAGVTGLAVGTVLGVITRCIQDPSVEWIFAEAELGGGSPTGGGTATA